MKDFFQISKGIYFVEQKKDTLAVSFFCSGGSGGIRTHEPVKAT